MGGQSPITASIPRTASTQKIPGYRIAEPLYHDLGWTPTHPKVANVLVNADDRLVNADDRANWLQAANTAVYGKDYKKRNKNVAAHFFNEADPNWHLDASILQYSARDVNEPHFSDWAEEWKHLGTEPLIALYLLKTKQHAYNLSDSVMIESSYTREEYPRLCNMRFGTVEFFRYATKELMGAQLNIAM